MYGNITWILIRSTSKGFVIIVEETPAIGPAIHAYNISLGKVSGNILDLNSMSEKAKKKVHVCKFINSSSQ